MQKVLSVESFSRIFAMRTFGNLQYLQQTKLNMSDLKGKSSTKNASLHCVINKYLNNFSFGCSNLFTAQAHANAFTHDLTTTAVCIVLSILKSALFTMYRFYSPWWENKSWFWYSSKQFGGFASLLYHGQLSQNLTRLLNRPAYFWYLSIKATGNKHKLLFYLQ